MAVSYLMYLILGHHISWCILSSISVYYSYNMLFRRNTFANTSGLSPTMTLYFIYVFTLSVLTLIYFPYYFIYFRLEKVIYDGKVLYQLGILPFILINTNSVIELCLCIDRCISILYPLKYTKRRQIKFAIITLTFTLLIQGVYFFNFLPYYPVVSPTTCRFFSCVTSRAPNLITIKLVFLILNIFALIILAIFLQRVLSSISKTSKRINRTILVIIAVTTLLELLPFIAGQVCLSMTGQSLSVYIGPYGSVWSSSTVALSSFIYFKALKKTSLTVSQDNNITVIP